METEFEKAEWFIDENGEDTISKCSEVDTKRKQKMTVDFDVWGKLDRMEEELLLILKEIKRIKIQK